METAVATVLSKIDGITALKEEQLTALEGVLEGKDVFALLPTGYGKSLIFQIARCSQRRDHGRDTGNSLSKSERRQVGG